MKYLILILTPFLFSCENTSQTAIRTNAIPAVAYITSPHLIEARAIIVPAR